MANYGLKYHFRWESANGNDYQIDLAQKDYEGPVYERRLGQAPVLRRDANERIWGSSLEIFAECQVDQEFAELYTTDPYEWRAQLFDSTGNAIWQGFVSPELYSEPDIAPPYDVQIIATDGIGELKFTKFSMSNVSGTSLSDVVLYLLGLTGFSVSVQAVKMIGDLSVRISASRTASLPPFGIKGAFEYWNGETCYDVLQDILMLINAVILKHKGSWWLIRESDINNSCFLNTTQVNRKSLRPTYIHDFAGIASQDTNVFPLIGSMNAVSAWWPVGQLSTTIEPAKGKIVIESQYRYREYLNTDPYFDKFAAGESTWNSTVSTGSYIVPTFSGSDNVLIISSAESSGALLYQTVDLPGGIGGGAINLRIVANTNNERGDIFNQDASQLRVRLIYHATGGGNYYLHEESNGSTYTWTSSTETVALNIPEGFRGNKPSAAEICLPSFTGGGQLEIRVGGAKGRVQTLWEIALVPNSNKLRPEGEKATVDVLNSGRDTLEESVDFTLGNATADSVREGVLRFSFPGLTATNFIQTMSARMHTEESSLVRFLAVDRAIQVALPRMICKGILNIPAGEVPPLGFFKGGNSYLLKTFSWDLYEDELEIEAISFPSINVSPSEWEVTETNQS